MAVWHATVLVIYMAEVSDEELLEELRNSN